MRRIKLDKIDRRILRDLQANGRMTNVDLGCDLGPIAHQHPDGVRAIDGSQLEAVRSAVLKDGMGRGDAETVAALLRFRAVRIEDAHRHRDAVVRQQAIRAQPSVPVADRGQHLDKLVEGSREVHHEVVVAEGLILDQVDHTRIMGNSRRTAGVA